MGRASYGIVPSNRFNDTSNSLRLLNQIDEGIVTVSSLLAIINSINAEDNTSSGILPLIPLPP
jgi:hypothetical protein